MAMGLFFVLCRAADRQFGSREKSGKLNRPYAIYVAFSFLIFSMVQSENWFWGWQITIFMSVLSTVCGYYILIFKPFGTNVSLLASIACGTIAMFSFANGFLYWPVGLFVMLMDSSKDKYSPKEYLLWIITATLLYGSYFYNYKQVAHHPSFLYGFSNPINLIGYFIAFVGSPIFQAGRYITISLIVGFLGLSAVIYLVLTLLRQQRLFDHKLLFWHSLLLYVFSTDVVTALGRSGFGVEQALSSRYVTISNLLWIWILVITYEVVNYHTYRRGYKLFPLVFFAACMLILLSGVRNIKVSRLDQQKLLSHEKQLRSGKLDKMTLTKIYQESPELVLYGNAILKKHHLSFYAH